MEKISATYYGKDFPIAVVTDHFRRHTNAENVPEQPYFTTTVTNLKNNTPLDIQEVIINAPAPGTPTDSLYKYPTVPCRETGYSYEIDTDEYPLVLTVHRPFIVPMAPITVTAGEDVSFVLKVRNPANDVSAEFDTGIVYNEHVMKNYSVNGMDVDLKTYTYNLPEGAEFNEETLEFNWRPARDQKGEYSITFITNDGIIPEKETVKIMVV
jgi:hypothetical protein